MTPTATAPAVLLVAAECPLEQVVVTNVRGFQDPQGIWRVAGVIENRWDQAVSKLVTAVEAIDSAGQVIDHGEDVTRIPSTWRRAHRRRSAPGSNATSLASDHFTVSVEECVADRGVGAQQG